LEPSPRTPDLIAEIKRVMKFQRALFSGESSDPETRKLLATALGRGVFSFSAARGAVFEGCRITSFG